MASLIYAIAFRVDFKTQNESGESSAEAQALVNAAQTIFQQGGELLFIPKTLPSLLAWPCSTLSKK